MRACSSQPSTFWRCASPHCSTKRRVSWLAGSPNASSRAATKAGTVASTYVSVTILLAAALFFSGVISSFKYRAARALLLAAALTALGVAASRLASLPVLF